MRTALAVTLTLLVSVVAFAQAGTQRCTNSVATSPALRGVKLGMTSKQVTAALDLSVSAKPHDSTYFLDRFEKSPYFGEKLRGSDSILAAMIKELGKQEMIGTVDISSNRTTVSSSSSKTAMLNSRA